MKKIKKEKIVTLINDILIKDNFFFHHKKHPVAHYNLYWKNEKAKEKLHPQVNSYDLAFYNDLVKGANIESHHRLDDPEDSRGAVFFMRIERPKKEKTALIGNIQIDCKSLQDWTQKDTGKIMMSPKNLGVTMIKEGIQHVLSKGVKDIMFQDGNSAYLAQFDTELTSKIKIDKDNYKKYLKIYEEKLKDFNKLEVGDVIDRDSGRSHLMVYEKNANDIKCFSAGKYVYSNVLIAAYYGNAMFTAEQWGIIKELIEIGVSEERISEKALSSINKFLKSIDKNIPIEGNKAKKVKFLSKQFKTKSSTPDTLLLISDFISEFNYEKYILKSKPYLQKYYNKKKDSYFYLNPKAMPNSLYKFKKDIIKKPEIGKNYALIVDKKYKYHQYPDIMFRFDKTFKVYQWYENEVPKILKKLDLGYEKVEISTKRDGRVIKSQAWKITSGLENFKNTPALAFATHGKFKKDTETIKDLEVAAEKFGLSKTHLNVINAWIIKNGIKHSASYNNKSDTIELSTPSLALLAHEGMHRLIEKNLIPKHEYNALVHAGKVLCTKDKNLKNYVEKTDRFNQSIYPKGLIRDNEYAAIFAEYYYQNRKSARKLLMTKKLTKFEKILDYIDNVKTVISAKLGNNAAIAAMFLKRVENNRLFDNKLHTNKNSLSRETLINAYT